MSRRAALESVLRAHALGATLPRLEPDAPVHLPASTGFTELDRRLGGGLPRGKISELAGEPSSGRTTLGHALLAEATRRGEVVALVDATDMFDPSSAAQAGIDLARLLWVRAGRKPHPPSESRAAPFRVRGATGSGGTIAAALAAIDLLLQAGGFGCVVLDVGQVPAAILKGIPFTAWYRCQRMIAHTPTTLVVLAPEPMMGNASAVSLVLHRARAVWQGVLAEVALDVWVRRPQPLAGTPPIHLACVPGDP